MYMKFKVDVFQTYSMFSGPGWQDATIFAVLDTNSNFVEVFTVDVEVNVQGSTKKNSLYFL